MPPVRRTTDTQSGPGSFQDRGTRPTSAARDEGKSWGEMSYSEGAAWGL